MKTPGDFSSPIWRYAGIGFELVAAIGLFIFIGWWVDGRFGTEPWGILVGAFIGVVGGMYNLIREALEAARSSGDGKAGAGSGKATGAGNGTAVDREAAARPPGQQPGRGQQSGRGEEPGRTADGPGSEAP